jgi:hypothetical protein
MRPRYLVLPIALALASGVAAAPLMQQARAAVEVSITVAPPVLPVYEQPALPGPGYVWTPGYWAYGPVGYFWVPGTWFEPPEVGLLWTPGYWAWANGNYAWNTGYWGPTVGFYGGVDYGFGYNGVGFYGGRWDHGHFAYNAAAWNVGGVHVANSYREDVPRNEAARRVSFNGGNGGIASRPTAEQERAAHERHVQATALQTRQEGDARNDPRLRASENHGTPPVAATARPGDFKSHPVAATNPATAAPAERNAARPEAKPTERNAARPEAKPTERNAARPEEKPTERNAARPTELRPEAERATKPASGSAMRPPERRPSAEQPAVAHPTAPTANHPAERPAVAHPTARPPIHPAARPAAEAPHPAPAARPAAPAAKPEEKKP